MNQDEALLAEAQIGIDLEAFKSTPAGRYLYHRAQVAIDSATEEWKKVNPSAADTIRELQNRVKVAEMAIKWIEDGITAGKHAELELRDNEDGEVEWGGVY